MFSTDICDVGYYGDATSCTACEQGTTTSATGATDQSDCGKSSVQSLQNDIKLYWFRNIQWHPKLSSNAYLNT